MKLTPVDFLAHRRRHAGAVVLRDDHPGPAGRVPVSRWTCCDMSERAARSGEELSASTGRGRRRSACSGAPRSRSGRGEVVALVGASGVGKSTLLHLLGALDRPSAGRVLFQGEDLFARNEAGLARYRRQEVGFVFQFYNLLGRDVRARERDAAGADRAPSARARRARRAAAALAEVGLGDRLRPPARRDVGRRAAARRHRARTHERAARHPGRRADREPRSRRRAKWSTICSCSSRRERGIAFLIATHNPGAGAARGSHLSPRRGARARGERNDGRRHRVAFVGDDWRFAGLVAREEKV